MEKQLAGKRIVIVGAAGLLGRSLVREILRQNGSVIAVDLRANRIIERLKEIGVSDQTSNLIINELDITNESEVKEFFAENRNIQGVVNAAYPRNSSYGDRFLDVSLASFNENVSLQLGSAFLLTQQCADYFKRYQKPISLINLSSIYGVVAPKFHIYSEVDMTMPIEYAAVKSAIQHLSKYAVSYVSNSNFRVNCVSIGGIYDGQPDAFLESYKHETLGKGMLDTNDVVGTILFLLADHSQYVNGQNIIVDDGFTL